MNSSFDSAAVGALLDDLGIDAALLARLGELAAQIRRCAPELMAETRREALLAHAETEFFRPLLATGMSASLKALLTRLLGDPLGRDELCHLLADWAATINPDEPAERAKLDCLPLQETLRHGALRAYDGDPGNLEQALAAIERLASAQLCILATVCARWASSRATQTDRRHALFLEQLRERLERLRGDERVLTVLLVDCGIVRRIDEVKGFHVGDELRSRIESRLRSEVLRQEDLIDEIGRDQFAVLVSAGSAGVALLAAQKLMRVLLAPFALGADEVYARPAVGIALYPEHGDNPAMLLHRAMVACVKAGETLERIAVYREQQEVPQARRLAYENRLRAAIEHGGLDLVFQPQVDLRTRRLVGVESLLRWKDSELGVIPPSEAIAAAESAGLINEVTWWVLSSALRCAADFRSRGLDLQLSVNLSANNLHERDLPEFVDRALRTWEVPAGRLVIEITETAVLGATERVAEMLARLKALGVRLSIDDFGTGYSSFHYLANMPFDEMKIDLSFVRDMLRVPQHERIVRSLVELAHNLGLVVIAEGVEDEAVARRLAELGCDRMQGYFAGHPLDSAEFAARYAR